MTGYTRKDTTNNIADGNIINAADLDNEFDGVQAAFHADTGHTHDGTAAEGSAITKIGPVQDVVVSTAAIYPKTTNTVDLGTSSLKYKDAFIAGNETVGGTLTVDGNVTLGNSTTDTVAVNGYMGVGGAASAGHGIYFNSVPNSSTFASAITTNFIFPATTTSYAASFQSNISAVAGSYTTPDVYGFIAGNMGAVGAGATVTNLHGFYVADQTRGTNNYGITSLVSSGTNKWNIYASGTANNYFAGNVGVGTTSPISTLSVTGTANVTDNVIFGDATTNTATVNGYMGVGGAASSNAGIFLRHSQLTGTIQWGFYANPTGNSSATSSIRAIAARPQTAAAAFTVSDVYSFYADNAVLGAGSTITNQHGLYIADQTRGTNNYGITSLVSSGTNKWNIYASGNAQNYFAGSVGIGTATPATMLELSANNTTITTDPLNILRFTDRDTSSAANQPCGRIEWYSGDTDSAGVKAYIQGQAHDATPDGNLVFATHSVAGGGIAERMRLDFAGNLGIGQTPSGSYLLEVNGKAYAASLTVQGTAAPITGIYQPTAGALGFSTSTSQAMTLSASGNLGLSVTPSAWGSEWSAMQYGFSGSVASYKGGTTAEFMEVISNAYNDNSNWRYIRDGAATRYEMRESAHQWYTAPSGIANAAITFTQAMTLDASGNLGIGTTLPNNLALHGGLTVEGSSGAKISLQSTGASTRNGYLLASSGGLDIGVDTATTLIRFFQSTSERMRIDSAGNIQVQDGAIVVYAPAPAAISTTATLTNANIQAQIINTTGTTYTVTMALGTTLETLVSWASVNTGYDFTVINTASGTITMAVNTGVTALGALTIATGISAGFRLRRTAANTFIMYRLR